MFNSKMNFTTYCIKKYFTTGLLAYSDNAGTAKKCLCNEVLLYPMIGPKNCHSSRSVTLTSVTVSKEACSNKFIPKLRLIFIHFCKIYAGNLGGYTYSVV